MKLSYFSTLLLCAVILGGCASNPETVSTDRAIRTIVVLYPMIDCRGEGAIALDKFSANPDIQFKYLSNFYMAKYKNVVMDYVSPESFVEIKEEDIIAGKFDALKGVVGNDSKVIVTYVIKLGYNAANSGVVCNMRLYLVDLKKGKILWRWNCFEEQWLGLIGGSIDRLMSGKDDSPLVKCFNVAITNGLQSFPYLQKEVVKEADPTHPL